MQLLHRGGGDAARDAEARFDVAVFDFDNSTQLATTYVNTSGTATITTANGGSVEADYTFIKLIAINGNVATVFVEFSVDIASNDPYQRSASIGEPLVDESETD